MSFTSEVLDAAYSSFYDNRPVFQATQTIAQTFATGAVSQMMYQYTTIDTYTGFNANTDAYTVQVAGYHKVYTAAHWVANATGARQIQVQINGVVCTELLSNRAPASGVITSSYVDNVVFLNVGDILTVWVDQTSGGNLATQATGGWTSVWTVEWLRD